MSFDFTLRTYRHLLESILQSGYKITGFDNYALTVPQDSKVVIIRHDIDKRPKNALYISEIEVDMDVSSTFYFKNIKKASEVDIIEKIIQNGHSIGYHYREFALCRGNFKNALDLFQKNLAELRKIYPVVTICMDGNPMSRFDNRLLWKNYNYRDFGIIAEPYFDIDYKKVLYLTDSGRRWDGYKYIVRDKVNSDYHFNLKSTFDIINSFKEKRFPDQIMINVHPERWNNNIFFWTEELIGQNFRNLVKKYFFVKRSK